MQQINDYDMENNDSQTNPMDLLDRMERIEVAGLNRRKRMMAAYKSTEPSRQVQKSNAYAILTRIVTDNPQWEQFKDYVIANPQEFSDAERKEIDKTLDMMKQDKKNFEKWKKDNITLLCQK